MMRDGEPTRAAIFRLLPNRIRKSATVFVNASISTSEHERRQKPPSPEARSTYPTTTIHSTPQTLGASLLPSLSLKWSTRNLPVPLTPILNVPVLHLLDSMHVRRPWEDILCGLHPSLTLDNI
ncbi:hypothetical protein WAI453_009891 [Rhynchosporium graminicola]